MTFPLFSFAVSLVGCLASAYIGYREGLKKGRAAGWVERHFDQVHYEARKRDKVGKFAAKKS